MHDKTKKKTALSIAAALTAPAITRLAQGDVWTGGTLIVFTVILFLYYDHVDDRVKAQVELPEHLSTEDIKKFGDLMEEHGPEVLDVIQELVKR